MQHDLDGVLRVVRLMTLAPVVADCVGKYRAVSVEGRGRDCAIDRGIALKAVLGVFVPTVGQRAFFDTAWF